MIYIIECKNDFPPATKYTIMSKKFDCEIPSLYEKEAYDKIIQRTSNDTLWFKCKAADPVEAMIKFWEKYMYGG